MSPVVVIVRLLAVTLPPVPLMTRPGLPRPVAERVALEICNLPESVTSIAAAFSPEVEYEPPVIVVVPPVAVTTPSNSKPAADAVTLFNVSVPPEVPEPGPL